MLESLLKGQYNSMRWLWAEGSCSHRGRASGRWRVQAIGLV